MESSSVSSISDNNSPEEDGAYCLMMLSRDKWPNEENYINAPSADEVKKAVKRKRKFRYESCRKVFRSYQALGGHRASHKKIARAGFSDPTELEENGNVEKIHECPFCFRVFSSGQALGGHKRSHFSASCFLSPSVK